MDLGDLINAVAGLVLVDGEGTSGAPPHRDVVHAQAGGPPSLPERIQHTPYLQDRLEVSNYCLLKVGHFSASQAFKSKSYLGR